MAIGISVIATYVSALSFLGGPVWSYSESLAIIAIHLNYPIVVFLVINLFLPFFFNSGVAPIYDYMEQRFGVGRKNSIGVIRLPIGTHDAARREPALIRDAWPVFSISP